MRDVIISDYACTDKICGSLVKELWPDTPPLVMTIPAKGASEAHRRWVEDFRATSGGRFLDPFISQRMDPSDVRSISLIGFSAGCWGVREILSDPEDSAKVSFVYACDGLHGKFGPGGEIIIQQPWLSFAGRAAGSKAMMVVSFSRIVPPSYPGTEPSAVQLGQHFGAQWSEGVCLPSCDHPSSVVVQRFGQAGNLMLVGSWPKGPGDDAAAHIYQANTVQPAVWRAYLAPWLAEKRAWGSPKNRPTNWSMVAGVASVVAALSVGAWWSMRRRR